MKTVESPEELTAVDADATVLRAVRLFRGERRVRASGKPRFDIFYCGRSTVLRSFGGPQLRYIRASDLMNTAAESAEQRL